MIAIFPRLMASAFAGYYLALFLILWCLILRGISLEVGGHINDRLWQAYWDFMFVCSNFLLAILFGAAAGNVARGVPVDAQGNFSMAFFTDFNVRGHVGLLDWYTVSIAILAVAMLAAHGATYLTLKTEGPVHDRSEKWAKYLWIAAVPLLLVVLVESRIVRPDLPGRALFNPFWWIGLVVVATAAIMLISGRFRGIKFSNRQSAGHWSGRDFSGDASLNARTGQFTDRLCCCVQSEHVAARDLLVAAWFRARGLLFRLHLATLCRKGKRSARHLRFS